MRNMSPEDSQMRPEDKQVTRQSTGPRARTRGELPLCSVTKGGPGAGRARGSAAQLTDVPLRGRGSRVRLKGDQLSGKGQTRREGGDSRSRRGRPTVSFHTQGLCILWS